MTIKTIVLDDGEPEVSGEELAEIKSELAKTQEEIGEVIVAKIDGNNEDIEAIIVENTTDIKEEVKSWLEQALNPIVEAVSLLTTGLVNLSQKMETMETKAETSLIPDQSNTETTTSETNSDSLSSAQVENPVESAGESLAETIQEAAEEVQEVPSHLREIIRL